MNSADPKLCFLPLNHSATEESYGIMVIALRPFKSFKIIEIGFYQSKAYIIIYIQFHISLP